MVSFKKLVSFGAMLAACVNAIPAVIPAETSLLTWALDKDSTVNNAVTRMVDRDVSDSNDDVAKRENSAMLVQYSRQGRILFLLRSNLPQSIIDSLYTVGQAGPAKVLLDQFLAWIDAHDHPLANFIRYAERLGGVYGKGGGDSANDFGFGIQLSARTIAGLNIKDVAEAVKEWASQNNAVVKLVERANDFIDFATIGAGELKLKARSRTATCPDLGSLLKYASGNIVLGMDLNRNFRWGGKCA
ncbi:hypothetical protein F5B20DRAFT_542568 [Whalleya microplaca]|nr:hypothetical protein F5B20DRAFT_542568 [Whalleya microplaca]